MTARQSLSSRKPLLREFRGHTMSGNSLEISDLRGATYFYVPRLYTYWDCILNHSRHSPNRSSAKLCGSTEENSCKLHEWFGIRCLRYCSLRFPRPRPSAFSSKWELRLRPCRFMYSRLAQATAISGLRAIGPGDPTVITGYLGRGCSHLNRASFGLRVTGAGVVASTSGIQATGDRE